MKIKNLAKLCLLLLLILPSQLMIMAQDEEATDEVEVPDVLTEGIELRSEDLPELLDLEWVEYTDRDITMWLNTSFEQTPVDDLLEAAKQGTALIDPGLEPYIQLLANNPDLIRFVAFDTDTAVTGFVTNVIIVREKMLFDLSALELAEATVNVMPDSIKVRQEPAEYELEGFDSVAHAQWLIESLVGDVVSLVYIVEDGDYMYSITFSTIPDRADFDQAQAELALSTLVIDRTEEEAED